jgi:flagellar assembly protein FliH
MLSSRLAAKDKARSFEFQDISAPMRLSVRDHQTGARKSEADRVASVERDAYQKGFEAGRNSGYEMAEKKLEAILGRFAQSLDQLATTRQEIVSETNRDLVRLAIEIARKLVGREIKIDEEIVITLVQVALKRVNEKASVTVFLNPEDLVVVQAQLKASPQLFSERDLTLKVKEDLKRGDCLLESSFGNVDGRLSEQFNRVEHGLLAEF